MTDLYTAELKHDEIETVLVVTIEGVENDVYLGSSLDDDGETWESIGRLWVAAPRLLIAAEDALRFLEHLASKGQVDDSDNEALRAEIARARGTQ